MDHRSSRAHAEVFAQLRQVQLPEFQCLPSPRGAVWTAAGEWWVEPETLDGIRCSAW